MSVLTGKVFDAVLPRLAQPDHCLTYTAGELVSDLGTTAVVYRVKEAREAPVLVKVYKNAAIKKRLKSDDAYIERIMMLLLERDRLARCHPAFTFPRRAIYPAGKSGKAGLVGISMLELDRARPLLDLLQDDTARHGLTHEKGIGLAIALCVALHNLHEDPWRFVVGDLSPNNVFVAYDFSSVHFIDTDTYSFTPDAGATVYDMPAFTSAYRSPESFAVASGTPLSAAHDDFVLAILLFQLFMAMAGCGEVHPFTDLDCQEDANIRTFRFPYVDSLRDTDVPDGPASVYASWHEDIRGAFEATFTGVYRLTAEDWMQLLAGFRRSLL